MTFSFFRNFNKTICASRLTKPNNLLLSYCGTPVYLCTSREPSVEHLNTAKSLFKTISKLQGHSSNTSYSKIIASQLNILRASAQLYAQNCVRYVQSGGRLTAQGLANLYACAEQLKVNDKWLQIYAQPQIPHLIRNMSVDNLKDVQAGLKKSNGSNDFVTLVQKELKGRNTEQYQYVKRSVNEIAQFQQTTAPCNRNLLLGSIQGKKSTLLYYLAKAWQFERNLYYSYFSKKPYGYVLQA